MRIDRGQLETIRLRAIHAIPGTLTFRTTQGQLVDLRTVDRDLLMIPIERDVVVAMLAAIDDACESGEPQRPHKPDRIRVIDRGDWTRASGLSTCDVCACTYFDHASVRGYDWLTRLCDGRLVKL